MAHKKNIYNCKFSIISIRFKGKILSKNSFKRFHRLTLPRQASWIGLRSNISTCVNSVELTATKLLISFPSTIHFSQQYAAACVRSWQKFSETSCGYFLDISLQVLSKASQVQCSGPLHGKHSEGNGGCDGCLLLWLKAGKYGCW